MPSPQLFDLILYPLGFLSQEYFLFKAFAQARKGLLHEPYVLRIPKVNPLGFLSQVHFLFKAFAQASLAKALNKKSPSQREGDLLS